MESSLIKIQEEVTTELANPEVVKSLVESTFKGLSPESMKKAIVEGMIRGYKFKDFLERNIYAIPYGSNYSLVTSIDHARKIGMRSGVIEKSEPVFEMTEEGKVFSCMVTIKRRVGEDIGSFTAKVFFDEYSTNQNLWVKKPRTMIAKVAEMHALRMACPEELSQTYTEDELGDAKPSSPAVSKEVSAEEYKAKLTEAKNLDELKAAWAKLPAEAKLNAEVVAFKEKLKAHYENP